MTSLLAIMPITISLGALLVTAASATLSIVAFRRTVSREDLRKEDIFRWANLCIAELRALYIMLILNSSDYDLVRRHIALETSSLIDQGRLFFGNTGDFRAKILDQLVIAHRIACQDAPLDDETRLRFAYLSEKAAKDFVRLARTEVGRNRNNSEASATGEQIRIRVMAENITEEQLHELRLRLAP